MSFLMINNRAANGAKQTKSTGERDNPVPQIRREPGLFFEVQRYQTQHCPAIFRQAWRRTAKPVALESWVMNAGFRLGFVRVIFELKTDCGREEKSW